MRARVLPAANEQKYWTLFDKSIRFYAGIVNSLSNIIVYRY